MNCWDDQIRERDCWISDKNKESKMNLDKTKKEFEMPIIDRVLLDNDLGNFQKDFIDIIKQVIKSKGELEISIRKDKVNIYYQGNSLALISFQNNKKYKVTINKKFIEKTDIESIKDFIQSKDSKTYILKSKKEAHHFFQTKHINQICQKIRSVHYREELKCEQEIMTDNLNRTDLIIIDRQVSDKEHDRKKIDLLALRQKELNKYQFIVVEVKLGKNRELKDEVATQLKNYMDHIDDHFGDYKTCYEKQFEQKRKLGIIKVPDIDKLIIEKPVEGLIVVVGYSGIGKENITKLLNKYPYLQIKPFERLI
jgi:hypothetical protein